MYKITCDGFPLLDFRDNDLVLVNPKVSLEVNTVGEGSFTIYKNHPNYNNIKKLKSVLEVSDDNGVIFRGRATGDTVDFDNGMLVDMEGAMAYFNDSIVRPFNFPGDFQVKGDRVAFFLEWLIDNHNSQVQDFQKMKLGNVTVSDSNLVRSTSEYASTWEVLGAKLFDSSLGGYLCIRYEEDGNYIDYLSEFTETNSQEIVFGENLLDLKRETEASETYSAIIPFGAIGLTIEGLQDGDITDDIVKSGDTLFSKKAVDKYGWIYAPTSETTWEDVVDDASLLTVGVNWLTNSGAFLNAVEATAVDLHFTDKQVESLRIYKNVNVHSKPHGLTERLPLAKLGIDLLNPQNTKITVGKTLMALTERTAMIQDEAKERYSKLSKTDEQIKLEVQDELKKMATTLEVTLDAVVVTTVDENGNIKSVRLADGIVTADSIAAGAITADKIKANTITFGNLDADTQEAILSGGGISEYEAYTLITNTLVSSPNIAGGKFYNLTQDTWIEIGYDGGRYGFVLSDKTDQIFSVFDGDFGIVQLSAKGYPFLWLEASPYGNVAEPSGTWDFSGATVAGLGSNVVATAVFA